MLKTGLCWGKYPLHVDLYLHFIGAILWRYMNNSLLMAIDISAITEGSRLYEWIHKCIGSVPSISWEIEAVHMKVFGISKLGLKSCVVQLSNCFKYTEFDL